MPDSATPACEDPQGFPDVCPAVGESGYGQDGNTVFPIPEYGFTPDSEGVVDLLTGLIWEPGQSDDDMAPAAAQDRCGDLVLAGRDDWRIPTLREAFTIMDFGLGSPAISRDVFLTPVDGPYHTSTNAGVTTEYYAVNLGDALDGPQAIKVSGTTDGFVKCVTGAPPEEAADFRQSVGYATDARTGISFQTNVSSEAMTWGEALETCNELDFGGFTDWRLPTVKDIMLTIDPTKIAESRRVHDVFVVETGRILWTSTVLGDNDSQVMFDQTDGRYPTSGQPLNDNRFRCARGPDVAE